MAVKEIAIRLPNNPDGRVTEGDVVANRIPDIGIGRKEGHEFLWLMIDDSLVGDLGALYAEGQPYKFRYAIGLNSLRTRKADLDIGLLRDRRTYYQPYTVTDSRNGLHTQSNIPIPAEEIIYDKIMGRMISGER
jgi:hypothetical protein